MINIKIKSTLKNDLNEVFNIETLGFYNKGDRTLCYYENNIDVNLIIDGTKKIIIKRDHPDYYLELVFEAGKTTYTTYNIKKLNMDMKLEVYTETLLIKENKINLIYNLKLNEEKMGIFMYNLCFEEDNMEPKKILKEIITDALSKLKITDEDIIIEIPKDRTKGN